MLASLFPCTRHHSLAVLSRTVSMSTTVNAPSEYGLQHTASTLARNWQRANKVCFQAAIGSVSARHLTYRLPKPSSARLCCGRQPFWLHLESATEARDYTAEAAGQDAFELHTPSAAGQNRVVGEAACV